MLFYFFLAPQFLFAVIVLNSIQSVFGKGFLEIATKKRFNYYDMITKI